MLNERGAGRSQVITATANLGIDSYVRDLEALRQQFKLDRMALIGLSWGSAIVAKYADTHQEHVKRIVLLSPMAVTSDFSRRRAAHLLAMLSEHDIKRMQEIETLWDSTPDDGLPALCRDSLLPVLRLYVENPAHLNRTRGNPCGYPPDALRNRDRVGSAGIESLGAWDFRPMLRTIRVPTLVIEGEKSKVPLDDAREWALSLSNGRLLLIPNAGHMNWLDQPDFVVRVLDEFFRRRWPTHAEP